MPTPSSATRLLVISDLHLGGEPPYMMSKPEILADFIDKMPDILPLRSDEQLELHIAGDMIDFLALQPWLPWTPNPQEAVSKLIKVMDSSPFAAIFDKLASHLSNGHFLSIMVGNHDVELTIPQVQRTLLSRLNADRRQVLFIDDGSAYQVGNVLIEHGNRYDGANANDWVGLRAHRSIASRYEETPERLALQITPGSRLVHGLINKLKSDYPFIDLLNPEGKLTVLLALAFEPNRVELKNLARLFTIKRLHDENEYGLQPTRTYQVGGTTEVLDAELREIFGERYDKLYQNSEEVSFSDDIFILSQLDRYGIRNLIKNKKPIPSSRLKEIHTVLRNIMLNDDSYNYLGDSGALGMAAARMLTSSQSGNVRARPLQTVIMGHTHLVRLFGPTDRYSYINTGTWADLIYVPKEVQGSFDESKEHFAHFLEDLISDRRRAQHFTFADVRIEKDGSVTHAKLRTHYSTMKNIVKNYRE